MTAIAKPTLQLTHQFSDPDGFYEALLEAHDGLTAEESTALNARLILVLANQIGNLTVLKLCLDAAKA